MPIYAYKCSACGHAEDVMQKMSDPALTVCPACSASAYAKQVTAPNFALKGSGWYVTDFRNGNTDNKTGKAGEADGKSSSAPKAVDSATAPAKTAPEGASSSTTAPASPAPAAATPAPSSAPAGN